MSIQQRVAGSNWAMAICGHPVRPDEPHGSFLGELVCAPCDKEYTDLLRAGMLADMTRWLKEQAR